MASKICDTQPCERMEAARSRYFYREGTPPNPDVGFVAAFLFPRSPGVAPEKVNFKYCPFCGTRIAMGLVDWLDDPRTPISPLPPPRQRRSSVNGSVR